MTAEAPGGVGALDWVLVLAPYRKDADYLEMLLTEHEVPVRQTAGPDDLATQLAQLPGVLVATHEALNPAVMGGVAKHLRAQPDWSELPVVILLDRTAPHARIRAELSAKWPRSRQLFYQRPVVALELLSGIQAALLARRRQRDVRDHIEREIELRLELNHRVKNILASVSSIFDMTRRRAVSIEQLSEDFTGRLMALSDVHSAVFQAGGEVLELSDVVDLTFRPYRNASQDRIRIGGPAISVGRGAGTTLAMCLHELATNAIKYGALSRPEGCVQLDWAISQSNSFLTIQWVETGGPQVTEPSRTGYGTRYVRAALTTLFGTPPSITFHPEGLRCVAGGPLVRVL